MSSEYWLKLAMMLAGCVCVFLGILGLFLPMVPGALFLIIAAWLFARSSERFYEWLTQHKHLGPVIHSWQEGRGFQRQLRTRILVLMWLSMTVTIFVLAKIWIAMMLIFCGGISTAYILKQPVYD